jgi:[ribosomal protein S5]-alanine N-acetyltransferase
VTLPERITSLPVVLRAFVPSDAPRVAALCADPEVALTTAAIPHPYPEGAAAEWIATHAAERDAGNAWSYAVALPDDGAAIGAIALRAQPDDPDGSLGYWIGREWWNRGYATAAARALLAMAYRTLDVDLVTAKHLARNPASGRVLAKCGMTLARRERKPHRGGPDEEFCVWSIDRERWSALAA